MRNNEWLWSTNLQVTELRLKQIKYANNMLKTPMRVASWLAEYTVLHWTVAFKLSFSNQEVAFKIPSKMKEVCKLSRCFS